MHTPGLRILLLCHAFNGLAQRLFVALREQGHAVSVELDIADAVTEEAVALWRADLVLAPYLKRRLPEAVWRRVPCLVVHPGPPGDRGPSALDWALLNGQTDWAVTVLQATADVDGGPVWAWAPCRLRPEATKSSLYRHEITQAAVAAVRAAVAAFAADPASPPPMPAWPHAPHGWRPLVTRAQRAIEWPADDTETVWRKLCSGDGAPGALAAIAGHSWRLYDAHRASAAVLARHRPTGAAPGSLLARRGPAVLVATRDAALWIGHLSGPVCDPVTDPVTHPVAGPAQGRDASPMAALKRPAVAALAEAGALLPEATVSLQAAADEWAELRLETWGAVGARVGWLSFEVHNGALDERQCLALRDALRDVRALPLQVLVLAGGADFFCNGIHLHAIEAATHREGDSAADASWRNIQAIDDLVLELLTMTDRITVAALRGNAGAGGCFVALAADEVWAHGGVVLNPHYRNMGNLYGSEYWTYTLPRRIGAPAADALMRRRWPTGAEQALKEGLIDACFGADAAAFDAAARERASALAGAPGLAERIAAKAAARVADEAARPLADHRRAELERMHRNFYGFDPSYHVARHHFVHRKPHAWTPRHLALHR